MSKTKSSSKPGSKPSPVVVVFSSPFLAARDPFGRAAVVTVPKCRRGARFDAIPSVSQAIQRECQYRGFGYTAAAVAVGELDGDGNVITAKGWRIRK